MIFTWLRLQRRLDEKTKVYGFTRSWSKIGSAVSTVIAVVIVWWAQDYAWVFFLAIIPYVIGLINFAGYPKELEGKPASRVHLRDVFRHLGKCVADAVRLCGLRRLVVESMSFEGVYKAVEDYLQPVVQSMALGVLAWAWLGETRRSALLIGIVYILLYLGSAIASRHAHRFAAHSGGEERGSRMLWVVVCCTYAALVPLLYFGLYRAAVVGFVLLAMVQNLWQPMLVSASTPSPVKPRAPPCCPSRARHAPSPRWSSHRCSAWPWTTSARTARAVSSGPLPSSPPPSRC